MPGSTAVAPATPRAEGELHWIEFGMLDEDGKAMAGLAYRIELPDGRVETGKLDENGGVRIESIGQSGDCTLTFPELGGDMPQGEEPR